MPETRTYHRPHRTRIVNELGQTVTLAAGPEQFDTLRVSTDAAGILFLGLGPEPDLAASLVPEHLPVFYLESPEIERQLRPSWQERVPGAWQRLAPSALAHLLATNNLEIRCYRQAIRMFPSFWAPLLALCRLATNPAVPPARGREKSVLLVGNTRGLLLKELHTAFANAGYAARELEAASGQEIALLTEALRSQAPDLFFSINFAGLDPYGEMAALAEATGARVATWSVDNPWHLLSKLRAPYWKRIQLFVTDDSFCQGLRAAGATRVAHLPLAAWPRGMGQARTPQQPGTEPELLFVGRSAFPGKKNFFAGLRPPAALFEPAMQMLARGERPDFDWWVRALGLQTLWPGKDVRLAGLCAEECAQRLRLLSLQAAAECGVLQIHGDAQWRDLLPQAANVRLAGQVDYYGPLMELYAKARYTLNVTSLLLPRGLTQRHFDVWAAGGFLLSDPTPGLALFPAPLTQPITFHPGSGPHALSRTLLRLEKERGLRKDLAVAWRELISREHSFDARVATVLDAMRSA